MTEFALVLPILIIFFIGVVETGLLINDYISLSRAVSDACKFGSTLIGYSSAEVMIVGKLIDGMAANINKSRLRVVRSRDGHKTVFTKGADGSITPSIGAADKWFYFYDVNGTGSNFNDDTSVVPTDWRASYDTIKVEYDREMMIPFANLVITEPTITLTCSNTWPSSGFYPNLMGGFELKGYGMMPLAVDYTRCVYTGSPIEIKGNEVGITIPGAKGWLDLTNNNTGKLDDLVSWISDPKTAPEVIIPSWHYSIPGNKTTVDDEVTRYIGQKVMIPVYDQSIKQGQNGQYHIIGFAEFTLNATQPNPSIFATYERTIYLKK